MNAELLLEHFHRLGDAPDAVPRLRRFILDLAVRGKLVEQDRRDDRLVDWLAIREDVTAASDEEPPFLIPEQWCWSVLNHIADCRAGAKVAPNAISPEDWILDLEDIDGERGVIVERARFKDRSSKSTKASFNAGDLLYGKLRPYLNKVVVADADGFCTTEIVPIRPKKFLSADYLRCFLRSPYFLDYTAKRNYGMKMPRLGTKDLEGAPVPLPPLPEQHRIVAKVEELMALCDRLEAAQQQRETERTRLTAAAWQAVVQAEAPAEVSFALEQLPALTTRPAQVKALRQTILDLAVRGRLVEQDAKDEPAEVLLERIRKEKERLVKEGIQKPERRRGNTVNGDVDENLPNGWAPTTLGEVALKITDGAHKTPTYVEKGVPFISVKDFSGGKLDLSNTRFIPPHEHKALYERCDPRRGDILLGRIGTLGCPVIVDTDVEFSLFVSVGLLRFDQKHLDIRYIKYLLESPLVRQEFDRIKIGGATHTNKLNLGDLHTIAFPLPPLAEQRRIVTKVEALMALCDGLEAALAAGEALRGKVLEATIRSDDQMIGRSDNGPRAEVVQKPKVRALRYVEPEEEMEMEVAADPVGHSGALHAVVRRGPGRPPKNGALTSTAARAIEAYLHAHPGWHGKAAILEATGVDAGAWNAAIKELLERGKVERQGEKKGARYRAA